LRREVEELKELLENAGHVLGKLYVERAVKSIRESREGG